MTCDLPDEIMVSFKECPSSIQHPSNPITVRITKITLSGIKETARHDEKSDDPSLQVLKLFFSRVGSVDGH